MCCWSLAVGASQGLAVDCDNALTANDVHPDDTQHGRGRRFVLAHWCHGRRPVRFTSQAAAAVAWHKLNNHTIVDVRRLRAIGTSATLKATYGAGFRLDVTADNDHIDAIDAFVRRTFADAESLSDFGCTRRYQVRSICF